MKSVVLVDANRKKFHVEIDEACAAVVVQDSLASEPVRCFVLDRSEQADPCTFVEEYVHFIADKTLIEAINEGLYGGVGEPAASHAKRFLSKEERTIEDHSKSNPGLHLHYIKTAVRHLIIIDKSLAAFSGCANLNMHGPYDALWGARQQLIAENMAYAEADEILKIVARKGKREPLPEQNKKEVTS